jgi:hypothetical protein
LDGGWFVNYFESIFDPESTFFDVYFEINELINIHRNLKNITADGIGERLHIICKGPNTRANERQYQSSNANAVPMGSDSIEMTDHLTNGI